MKTSSEQDNHKNPKKSSKSKLPKQESVQHPPTLAADQFSSPTGVFSATPDAAWLRSLQGYEWEDNSCFSDTGMELLFRAFVRWSPTVRHEFVNGILATELKNSTALLPRLFYHYAARLKWILSTSKDTAPRSTFKIIHDVVHSVLCKQRNLTTNDGMGCAYTWLEQLILVSTSFTFQQIYFDLGVIHRRSIANKYIHTSACSTHTSRDARTITLLWDSTRLSFLRSSLHTTTFSSAAHAIPRSKLSPLNTICTRSFPLSQTAMNGCVGPSFKLFLHLNQPAVIPDARNTPRSLQYAPHGHKYFRSFRTHVELHWTSLITQLQSLSFP